MEYKLKPNSDGSLSIPIDYVNYANSVFSDYLNKTAGLAELAHLVLSGEKRTCEANGIPVLNNKLRAAEFVAAPLQEKLSILIGCLEENYLPYIKMLKITESKPVLFDEHIVPDIIYNIGLFCFMMHHINKDEAFKAWVITPIEYQTIKDSLDFTLKFSSRLASHSIKYQDASLNVREIMLSHFLPFFMHHFFVVESKYERQGNRKKHKMRALHYSLVPMDLKTIPAGASIAFAFTLLKKGDTKEAKDIIESLKLAYQPENTKIPKVCKEYLTAHKSKMDKIYQKNKQQWNSAQREHQKGCDIHKGMKHCLYLLWLKLELAKDPPTLARITCYLDLLTPNWVAVTQNQTIYAFDNYSQYFFQTGKLFEERGEVHNASRYYAKAIEISRKQIRKMPDFTAHLDISNIKETITNQHAVTKERLATLQNESYEKLKQQWEAKAPTYKHLRELQFIKAQNKVVLQCTELNAAKVYIRHLKRIGLGCKLNPSTASVDVAQAHFLSMRSLTRSLYYAEKELGFVARRNPLNTKEQSQELSSENETADDAANIFTYQSWKQKTKYKKPKVKKHTNTVDNSNNEPEELVVEEVSWGPQYPTYSSSSNAVFPFPNDQVKNAPMVKGVFYGYIPEYVRAEFPNETLCQRFIDQLQRGSIARKGRPQGIRCIHHESTQDADSDYLFKINIGKEDIRLYGRKVALTLVDNAPKVLIAFDQLVGHKDQLTAHESTNSNFGNP